MSTKYDEYNIITFLFITIVVLLLGVSIFGFVMMVVSSNKKQTLLTNDRCVEVSKVKTGKKVYCGKACFRPELKVTYQCTHGEKTRIYLE